MGTPQRVLKLEAKARRLRAAGTSTRDIAAQCKRSPGWVRVVLKRDVPAPDVEPEAPAEPPPAVPTLDAEDALSLEQVTEMLRSARRSAAAAERDGNHGAAQRYLRDATALIVLKARLERVALGQDDAVTLPRAELAAAQQSVRERLQRLAARPLTCAHCGRELRIAIAKQEG